MRILIAEDEAVSAKVLSKMVSRYGDVKVTANGEEAFEAFQDAFDKGHPYEIVFLDILMPEVDGQETLAAIREYEEMKGVSNEQGVKVVMVTALHDGPNLYEAHKFHCTDYITKPISKEGIEKVLIKQFGKLPEIKAPCQQK